jgi:ubiquinone/menaquinone biosynthesis C-methylase UbiE
MSIRKHQRQEANMTEYKFKQPDFDNPSFLFRLEDKLKGFLGGPFYRTFIKAFALKGDEHVLDFGCGGGVESRFVLEYLEDGGRITCIDLSDYWIQRAKKRLNKYPNASCIQGDIRKLEIPNNFFDMIFTIHVIHDIAPEERQSTVDALASKLKPHCPFYIWEPTKISHGMPIEEIRELLSNAGLEEQTHEKAKSSYKGKFLKIR